MSVVDRLSSVVQVALLAGLIGCAAAGGAADAPPDPAAAAALAVATSPEYRLEVLFDWNMVDRDARIGGRGLLRLDRAARARVDLFGPRGETLAAAIMDGTAMRVVPQAASAMLPPPALLWAALGVFREPEDAPLTATRVDGDQTRLEYSRDRTRWTFQFAGSALRSTEWTDGSGRRTVTLTGDAGFDVPRDAAFRDWTEFRELNLSVTAIEERTSFDADTWILPGER
ncbi:hypothetical protein BH23GEM10_BH23GEM10_18150 [soil metagenome]